VTLTESQLPPELERRLSSVQLLFLGVGAIIGAGVFVMTGTAAAQYAGPAIVVSFGIAAIACLCSGLCYAELASMFPQAAGAYSFARIALGELGGWVVGWCLLLEYLVAAAAVASGWSGYFTSACAAAGLTLPHGLSSAPVNLPATAIVSALSACAMWGAQTSTRANTILVITKICVIALFLVVGAVHVDPANWRPFLPPNSGDSGHFGWSGVVRGAGVVFFAYLGFDCVATASQEARRPQKDIPRAVLGSITVCTALYVLMALVMTGLTSYRNLAVSDPVAVALHGIGNTARWLEPLVDVGILAGLTSVILVLVYAQSRVLFVMARDGLLPAVFGRIHDRYRTPHYSVMAVGVVAAALATLLPLDILGTLVSMGTLFAFVLVAVSLVRLRRSQPSLARPFRLPLSPYVPGLGIAICLYLMVGLGAVVWLRFAVWLTVGILVYGVRPGARLARA
jgi:APA family basic amino acid/polyamine antiporter